MGLIKLTGSMKGNRTDANAVSGPSAGRALASDFDNTLYFMRDEEPLRAADIFAILYFQQRGGIFGICTGRSLVGVREVIGMYIRPDFYILASGALVVDGQEKVLFKKCLPLATVEGMYHRYAADLEIVIQANDTVHTFGEPGELKKKISSFDDLRGADVYGLSMAAPDVESAARVTDEINALYGDAVTAFHNVTHVDVAPRGCSKGNGADIVRRAFSIREMYGIGDSYNDLPLLRAVDHPYTFPHAPRKVQEVSEGIVRGVSELLDRI